MSEKKIKKPQSFGLISFSVEVLGILFSFSVVSLGTVLPMQILVSLFDFYMI
jgi:hypothetical protein